MESYHKGSGKGNKELKEALSGSLKIK